MGRRDVLSLALLSFVLRLALWLWVVVGGAAPLHDEVVYLRLAAGWARVFGGDASALGAALGDGRWPPLFPWLLTAGLAVGGAAGARLVGVLLGAASTALVFALTRRLAGRTAARGAALIHAVAPAFLFYSHSLWSESAAIVVALAALVLAVDARRRLALGDRRTVVFAVGAGALLGALGLVRTALAPWTLAVPLWLALTAGGSRRRRALAAAACLAASLLGLLPWAAVQQQRFGAAGLSTVAGYNLALGNHPRVPAGYGSSWGHQASKYWLQQELQRVARGVGGVDLGGVDLGGVDLGGGVDPHPPGPPPPGSGEGADGDGGEILGELGEGAAATQPPRDWRRVAAPYALAEVKARPAAAAGRAAVRLWLLFAPDVFPVRHLVHGAYPALGAAASMAVIAAVVLAHVLTLASGVAGLLGARFRRGSAARSLLVGLAAVSALGPTLSVAATRFHLPIEALMLPAIGAWIAGRRRAGAGTRATAIGLALAAAIASLAALPRVAELYWQPSAQRAAPWLGAALRPLGVELVYTDRYRVEGPAPPGATLRVGPAGAAGLAPRRWLTSDDGPRRPWPPGAGSMELDILSTAPGGVVEIVDGSGRRLARWRLDDVPPRGLAARRGDFSLTWVGGGTETH